MIFLNKFLLNEIIKDQNFAKLTGRESVEYKSSLFYLIFKERTNMFLF